MAAESQKLSVTEKVGYSLGDAAANFVFMTMVLFQANFYTDVMGIAVGDRRLAAAGPAAVGRILRSGDGRRWPTGRGRGGAASGRGFCSRRCPGAS